MLTRRSAVATGAIAVLVGVGLLGTGCGDDAPDDPAAALAHRVSAILESDSSVVVERLAESGSNVSAEALADALVVCPRVRNPQPGDLATCRVTAAGTELELDVEFQDDGGIEVTALAPAP